MKPAQAAHLIRPSIGIDPNSGTGIHLVTVLGFDFPPTVDPVELTQRHLINRAYTQTFKCCEHLHDKLPVMTMRTNLLSNVVGSPAGQSEVAIKNVPSISLQDMSFDYGTCELLVEVLLSHSA